MEAGTGDDTAQMDTADDAIAPAGTTADEAGTATEEVPTGPGDQDAPIVAIEALPPPEAMAETVREGADDDTGLDDDDALPDLIDRNGIVVDAGADGPDFISEAADAKLDSVY